MLCTLILCALSSKLCTVLCALHCALCFELCSVPCFFYLDGQTDSLGTVDETGGACWLADADADASSLLHLVRCTLQVALASRPVSIWLSKSALLRPRR